jgi:hypothetical protein
MARPQGVEGGDGLQIWRVAANILNKHSRTADKVWFSNLEGWTWGYKLLAVKKKKLLMKIHKKPRTWMDSLNKRPKRKKLDMRIVTWNFRSMHRAGSLRVVTEEVLKYKLDLVGVEEVRWDQDGTEPAGQYTFFYGNGNQNHELGTGILCIRESYQQ